ncbi:MAG: FkbM family methyltransferase [Ignavibacteria bacterium]
MESGVTKNYLQKLFVRKVFGKRLYRSFKMMKIYLMYLFRKNYEISDFFEKLITPDFVILDIGANLGQYLLRFHRLVKSKGKVYSFEPVEEDYKILLSLKKFLHLNSAEIFRFALSNSKGESVLYIPVLESSIELDTQATINLNNYKGVKGNFKEELVEVTTIDDIVNKLGITKLDLIKSDTEGNDYKVIEGGMKTIERFHPFIFIEENHRESWLKSLYDMEYCPYYVVNNSILKPAEKVTEDDNVNYDLMALIHREKLKQISKFVMIK